MNFLKTIGKFFAGLLVLLGITIFIMSYFGTYAVNNFHVLEKDINDYTLKSISEKGEMDIEQFREYCRQNSSDENCKILNQNPITEQIKKEINDFVYYGNAMRIIGFIIFLLGFLLFALCSGFLNGLRQTSLISLIGSLFSYFYYKYMIMGALNSFLPPEILGMVNNWAIASINQIVKFVAVLIVIFLILTIVLYVLKHKKKIEGRTNGS